MGALDDLISASPSGSNLDALLSSQPSRSWVDVAGSAILNAPRSAGRYVNDITQGLFNPVNTGAQLANVVNEQGVGAIGEALVQPYTGMENFKDTLAEDPFRVLGDAAAVTGIGGGVPGRVGRVSSAVSRAIDPLMLPSNIGRLGVETWGAMSGTGARPIAQAAKAGAEGGIESRRFLENYTGAAPIEQPVMDMRNAVRDLKGDRSAAYRKSMAQLSQNRAVLNFAPIDNALLRINSVKTFKGQNLSTATDSVRQEIGKIVGDWKKLDPQDFHTAEGLDALKKKIYEEFPMDKLSTAERKVVGDVTNSIKNVITKQAPEYAKIMEDYSRAENSINELTRALSAGERASVDTALRKLQSVMRNNVNTNYGYRAKLAELITQKAPGLESALAGQALNTGIPRGGAGWLSAGGALSIVPLIMSGKLGTAASVLAGMVASSPKIAGGAAYGAGVVSRPAYKAAQALSKFGVTPRRAGIVGYQGGKTKRETQPLAMAEKVLSPDVLNYIKSAPGTRSQLSKWAQAVRKGTGIQEASLMLGDAIAQELNRPDLAERIAEELIPR